MTEDLGSIKRRRFMQVGLFIAAVAAFGGLAHMVTTAIEMSQSGRGMETYRTTWMVEFNWIGFLVLMGGVVAALLIAAVVRLWEYRELKELEAKYPGKGHG